MDFEQFSPVIIGIITALITGGIPAYLSYKATNKRLDSEADERDARKELDLSSATQAIVESAQHQIENIEKAYGEQIKSVQNKADLALREVKLVKEQLSSAQDQIDNLTILVCELYSGALLLIEQLQKEGLKPKYDLPTLPERVQKILEDNGWH